MERGLWGAGRGGRRLNGGAEARLDMDPTLRQLSIEQTETLSKLF